MPYNLKKQIQFAKNIVQQSDAVLIICGAGMSVESGIPTYRGNKGIWEKEIQINGKNYAYDEISSLKMWQQFPELAWGFKSMFYQLISKCKPHQGYYHLLQSLQQQFNNNYFICTSNIDGFFAKSGFDPEKIYEVHGTIDNIQCMDKKCSIREGVIPSKDITIPKFDSKTLIAKKPP